MAVSTDNYISVRDCYKLSKYKDPEKESEKNVAP